MLFGLKPVALFNIVIAATALLLSAYTFFHDRMQEKMVQRQATDRMLYGGYMLGRDYELLVLCAKGNPYQPYTQCFNATQDRDFAKLDPLSDVEFGFPFDWLSIRGSQSFEDPKSDFNDLGPSNIVNKALSAHFLDRRVADAFVLGRATRLLSALAADPATVRVKSQQDLYTALVGENIDKPLAELLGPKCATLDAAAVPNSKENASNITSLLTCINSAWLPNPT